MIHNIMLTIDSDGVSLEEIKKDLKNLSIVTRNGGKAVITAIHVAEIVSKNGGLPIN